MNKVYFLFGMISLITGLILSYFLIVSLLKFGEAFTEMEKEAERMLGTQISINMLHYTPLVGGLLILIGVYLLKRAFRKI